jgi:hypothetical protein
VEVSSTAFGLIRQGYLEVSIALWVRLSSPLNVIASVSTARLALLNQEETKWSPGKIR